MTQPAGHYTEDDFERILARDFPAARREEARTVLAGYGGEDWHPEPLRVRMACLKLADGDIDELRRAVAEADLDFRDVLSAAEYRRYRRAHDEDAKKRAIEEDWAELQAWLHRR